MLRSNAYQQYQKQSILTASPGELTLMLYNGCIKFINQAKLMIEKKDIAGAHEAIMRAEAIIEEFMQTLDTKYEISNRFMMIYDYIYRRLVDANISKDIKILDEVLGLVTELRNSWKEMLNNSRQMPRAAER